ncbi:hypothetical protein GPSY_1330 [Paraglaciecola psychrophila 170]|nr:hypothetical protein GPSY_1330 [Paraglaciecola psychrophila 170]
MADILVGEVLLQKHEVDIQTWVFMTILFVRLNVSTISAK